MSEYDNNMTGALFKNNKRTTEKQPEYTGNCEINGQEFWVSAWIRESKNGNKFFSMAYTPKEQNVTSDDTSQGMQKIPEIQVDVNDQIPF